MKTVVYRFHVPQFLPMQTLGSLIPLFISAVAGEKLLEVYNEFCLQHELGIFPRNSLPDLKA